MDREALARLSRDDLIAIILAQAQQINALTQQVTALSLRIAELEAKLAAPVKTPNNSSLPPSQGQKPNLPPAGQKPRPPRPGVARALAEHPDATISAMRDACPHCAHALGAADQPEFHAYDHIDLPPIRPIITRINRHRGICPCCRKRFAAAAPAGRDPGSPFGPELCALIIHLHATQAIGFERLARLMLEVFGVVISQGAIANILARAQQPLLAAVKPMQVEMGRPRLRRRRFRHRHRPAAPPLRPPGHTKRSRRPANHPVRVNPQIPGVSNYKRGLLF